MKNLTKDIKFQIYALTNKDSVLGYPYVGVSTETKRVIDISPQEHISIGTIHRNDKTTFDHDYALTEQYFNFDLHFLDDLIESYIGKEYIKKGDYSLTAYFNTQKEIVISYRTKVTDIYQEENLSGDISDTVGKEIVSVIFLLLQSIKV